MTHQHCAVQAGGFLPAGRPAKKPSVVPGILLIIAGVLGLGVGLCIFVIPMFLFLLGGGGNVDAFDDVASGFFITGFVVAVISVLVLIAGIVLTTVVAKRRRMRPQVWMVMPPGGPRFSRLPEDLQRRGDDRLSARTPADAGEDLPRRHRITAAAAPHRSPPPGVPGEE